MTSRLIFAKRVDFKLFGENFVKNQRSDRETSCIKSGWEKAGASAGQEEKVKPEVEQLRSSFFLIFGWWWL